jgi:hypothetical protein
MSGRHSRPSARCRSIAPPPQYSQTRPLPHQSPLRPEFLPSWWRWRCIPQATRLCRWIYPTLASCVHSVHSHRSSRSGRRPARTAWSRSYACRCCGSRCRAPCSPLPLPQSGSRSRRAAGSPPDTQHRHQRDSKYSTRLVSKTTRDCASVRADSRHPFPAFTLALPGSASIFSFPKSNRADCWKVSKFQFFWLKRLSVAEANVFRDITITPLVQQIGPVSK